MTSPHYDLARARRSLAHFGIGRISSAVTGFLWLMLAVRAMSAEDYGAFVVVLAILEIFYLVTGVGLSTMAQRYVSEFRIKASGHRLRRFVAGLVAGRALISVLAAVAVAAAGNMLLPAVGVRIEQVPAIALVAILVTGCLTRYFDELFAALLLQAYTQSLAVLKNLLRVIPLAMALMDGTTMDTLAMIWLEISASLVVALAALVLLWRYLRREADGDPAYAVQEMWPVSMKFYLIQVIGQVYGVNILKLLVSRLLGLEATAVLGFTQSLVDMVRNYLPAHLLAGWIRPLLVSRFVDRSDFARLSMLAGLVLKINLLGICPLVLFFLVGGDGLGSLLSGGRFTEAGSLFVALSVLLGFQTVHLLLSMMTLTLAKPNANLLATILACFGLPLAAGLAPAFGVEGVIYALTAAETVWCGTVIVAMLRDGYQLAPDSAGYVRLLGGTVVSIAIAFLLQYIAPSGAYGIAVALVPVAIFMLMACHAKPLSSDERLAIGKFVPLRYVPF